MKNVKIGKMAKMGKLKWGRLGRYRNRQEAGKNVLNSWDRDLSVGDLKWCVRGQEKYQNGQYVFGFRDRFVNVILLTVDFLRFSVRGGSEKLNFAVKNKFSLKFWSKTFFCHPWQFLWKMKKWDSLKGLEKYKISPKCWKSMPWNLIFDGFWIKSSPILTRARWEEAQYSAKYVGLD